MKRCGLVAVMYQALFLLLMPWSTYLPLKDQGSGAVAESVSPSVVLAMLVAGNLVTIRLLFLLWKTLYQEAARARASVRKRRLTIIAVSCGCVLYAPMPFVYPFFSARYFANRADERVAVRSVIRSVMAECGSVFGTVKEFSVSARQE